MKKFAVSLALSFVLAIGLLASAQTVGVPVEGKVTKEGKPLPNVQVVLTNLDNGRTYKAKTEKNGNLNFMGVAYGNYRVEVIGDKGEKLFSNRTSISADNTTSTNNLTIDIKEGAQPVSDSGGAPSAPGPKLTKEQLAKIEADNKKIAGLNSLIKEADSARQAQDWPKAENALKQLIAAAPDTTRWEFYYALGEAQSRSNKPEEAVQTFDKGIQVAQSIASGSAPPDPKNPNSTPAAAKSGEVKMLTSQGSAYLKLQKQDEAIASLKKAAELDPGSSLTQYNLCGVEYNAQKFDDAKTSCNKYLQLEPSGAHADEVKTFLSQMGTK
ncbi:MAG TPA: tetratricopeptide repeat protein [Candidatus Angelobacter sp.]|nr:tetratricopeptide repeat protein [Candidatus Angelobacter sp.]